ncbi:MAG: hypothetical protein LBG69_03475 [Zoogloeaceae bacterium]|nr:hypothetical protein [Zoogloeaceae bacterium]
MNDFARGALLSVVMDRLARENRAALNRAVARAALQNGVALAVLTVAADALQQRRYARAALAAIGAAASVYALTRWLPPEERTSEASSR